MKILAPFILISLFAFSCTLRRTAEENRPYLKELEHHGIVMQESMINLSALPDGYVLDRTSDDGYKIYVKLDTIQFLGQERQITYACAFKDSKMRINDFSIAIGDSDADFNLFVDQLILNRTLKKKMIKHDAEDKHMRFYVYPGEQFRATISQRAERGETSFEYSIVGRVDWEEGSKWR